MKEVENTQITSVDHELQGFFFFFFLFLLFISPQISNFYSEILDYGENLESLKPNFEEFSFQVFEPIIFIYSKKKGKKNKKKSSKDSLQKFLR